MPKAWIIIDDKVSNAKQAIAVAKALGCEYTIKKISYNILGSLPNFFKFSSLLGIDLNKSDNLSDDLPDIIISLGRRTAPISAYLKKQNKNLKNIHIMNPQMDFKSFDLIYLPLHDQKLEFKDLKNIFYTVGAPCYVENNQE